jgi:hypothetical protein
MFVNSHAGGLGGDAQGLDEFAIVDLMVLRAKHRAGDFSRKMRFFGTRRGGRQPSERQIETALKLEPMGKLAMIVSGQSEDKRALAAQFDIDAGDAEKLRGKTRPTRLTLAAERDQRFLAGLGLTARREHAGRCMACTPAGVAAIKHRDRRAARKPPCDAKPDYAGAEDRNARPIANLGKVVRQARLPSLE